MKDQKRVYYKKCVAALITGAPTRTLSMNIILTIDSVQVQVLTCDKLSHCLFDFDCVDLNVYEKEQYNYDYFEIKDLISTGELSSETTTHDSKIKSSHFLVVLYRS